MTFEVLTVKEVAKMLDITPPAVYRAVKERRIKHFRIGSAIRFVRTDVEETKVKDAEKKQEKCPKCGRKFDCSPVPGTCWCEKYPNLKITVPLPCCLCETCLKEALIEQGALPAEEKTDVQP